MPLLETMESWNRIQQLEAEARTIGELDPCSPIISRLNAEWTRFIDLCAEEQTAARNAAAAAKRGR